MRGKDEQERGRIESQVFMPLRGEEVTSGPWSAEAEMAAFADVKAQFGGR